MSDALLTQEEIDALLGVVTQPVSNAAAAAAAPPILNPDEIAQFKKFMEEIFIGGQEALAGIVSAVTKAKVVEVAEIKNTAVANYYTGQKMHILFLDFDEAVKGRSLLFINEKHAAAMGELLLGGDAMAPAPENLPQYNKALEECFKRYCDTFLKDKLTQMAGGVPFVAGSAFSNVVEFKAGYDPGLGADIVCAKVVIDFLFNGEQSQISPELFLCFPMGLARDIISLMGMVALNSAPQQGDMVVSPSASQSLLITNQDEIDALLNQATAAASQPAPSQPVQQPQQQAMPKPQPVMAQQPQQQPLQQQQPQQQQPQYQQQPMMGQQQPGMQQPMGGYPPQYGQDQMMGGYPPQYMQQQPMGGYPPQYMQQQPMGGFQYPPQYMQQPPQQQQNVQPAKFTPLNMGGAAGASSNIELLMDVPLTLTVELGRTKMLIREILELTSGSIIELDKIAGESIDVLINNKLVAKGEVMVIDENFGIRITNIISPQERLQSLK